jgi:hypothetical protein
MTDATGFISMKNNKHIKTTTFRACIVICGVLLLGACATAPLPEKASVVLPQPRMDSEGAFLSPFTSDEVVAPWVEKGMAAGIGAEVGALAGQKAMESVPFVGGLLGDTVGRSVGRSAAIELVGGMDYMRSTTDMSFDNVNELIVYTWVKYEQHPSYAKVVDLIGKIYPEYGQNYMAALTNAPTSLD